MLVVLLNDREVTLIVAELFVVRHEVKRIVEYLSENLVLTEEIVESKTVFHLNDIEVVCVIDFFCLKWSLYAFDILEGFILLAD